MQTEFFVTYTVMRAFDEAADDAVAPERRALEIVLRAMGSKVGEVGE